MKARAFFAILLMSPRALAEEPLPTPDVVTFPPGEDSITVVKKSEPAPYAGQLFDNDTALRWAMWLQQYKLRYGLDLKATRDSCNVLTARENEYRKIEAARNAASEADLKARLLAAEKARMEAEEKLRNPPFWERTAVWFSAGVLTTAVAVVVTVAASK